MNPRCWVAAIVCSMLVVLAAPGCTLPAYEKVATGNGPATAPDGGPETNPVAQCAQNFPAKGACGECIATHCCDEVAACNDGACGEDIAFPISPVMSVNEKFDELVSCMQQNCDAANSCNVSWGCVDKYRWPRLRQDRPFSMRIFNYADVREAGLPGIDVQLCEASDPRCEDGLLSTATTGSDGLAEFIAPRGFNGYFSLSGGKPTPAVVVYSQPVFNLMEVFAHQALLPDSIATLGQVVGWRQDGSKPAPNTGHLLARAQNCLPLRYLDRQETWSRGKNVIFNFAPREEASQVYYVNDMAILDPTLKRTTSRGYGGAFEVPAKNISVTATDADSGDVLASGVITIRPNTIGYIYLFPTPTQP
jgi:hypothetical protein